MSQGPLPLMVARICEGRLPKVFEYISRVLAEVEYSLADVVKMQAFIASAEDYAEYNGVRRTYFPEAPPASTTVVASLALPEWLVEVEVVAYKE